MVDETKTNEKGAKATAKRPEKEKEWTVMVYFAGDNNLSEEMIYAIKEMYRVGVTPDFDVVVQFDPSAIGPRVRRYVISQERLASDIEWHAELAPAIGMQKSMAAPSLHAAARVGHQRSTDPARRSDEQPFFHHQRKTDAIASLDVDGTIERLGILLPVEGADADAERRYQQQRRELQSRGLSEDYAEVRRLHPARLNVENSADPRVLENFICESMRGHPAKRYMLVLSGHGSGSVGDFLQDNNPNTPDKLLSSLSIPSLKRVLDNVQTKTGKKVHILGMDSCLMSMAEIGYELRDSVDFVVGSEGFVSNTGWPYHRILETLKAKSTIEPEELARTIVQRYIAYYGDYEAAGASTDQSVCDLQQLKAVLPQIKDLAAALKAGLAEPSIKEAIVLAHWEAQSYKAEQYTDLYDFCERLQLCCIKQPIVAAVLPEGALQEAGYKDQESLRKADKVSIDVVKQLVAAGRAARPKAEVEQVLDLIARCNEVRETIEGKAVRLSCYSGPLFQHSHGLSVYFPWFEDKRILSTDEEQPVLNTDEEKRVSNTYEQLAFAKDDGTGWAGFLKEYLKATRRERRNQKDHRGEEPVHIEPAVSAPASMTFSPVRSQITCRGGSVIAGGMKNPPDGFYRDECKTNKS